MTNKIEQPLRAWRSWESSRLLKTLSNKNLAIANRSRVSCAHNMSRASKVTPWPWNLG